jgi:hypothetical protein
MSPEFIQKWERLIEGVDKQTFPLQFVKKLILRLRGKKQQTINIAKLLGQGVAPEEIEEVISRKLIELGDDVVSIEFMLDIQSIAETVQPETDKLLNGL